MRKFPANLPGLRYRRGLQRLAVGSRMRRRGRQAVDRFRDLVGRCSPFHPGGETGVLRADLALRLAGALRRCFSGVSLNASRAGARKRARARALGLS